jgi:hypothetical protein
VSERRLRARGVVMAALISLALGGAALPFTWPAVVAHVYPWAAGELSGQVVSVTQDGERLAVAVKLDDQSLILIPRVPPSASLTAGARAFKRPVALSLQLDGAEWIPLVAPVERVSLILATWLAAATAADVVLLLMMGALAQRPTSRNSTT